jgi:alkanesulfonate monooxygenase SsuD/methylene tetrahydromethanopterin reductase-like flavin-dependent oxidoreductase (luciferase family)
MKKIGFLSFGHWNPSPHSQARTASDVLLQSIDLAVAAEEVGADGAYFRVHHFARQLASPSPLLAAAGDRVDQAASARVRWPGRRTRLPECSGA